MANADMHVKLTLDASKFIEGLEEAKRALAALDEASECTKDLRERLAAVRQKQSDDIFVVRDPNYFLVEQLLAFSERLDRLEAFAVRNAATGFALRSAGAVADPSQPVEVELADFRESVRKDPGKLQILPTGLEFRPWLTPGRPSFTKEMLDDAVLPPSVGVDMANGPDFAATKHFSVEKVAKLFHVPPELLRPVVDEPDPPPIPTQDPEPKPIKFREFL